MTMQEGIRPARNWALAVAALILVMVVVGGATRLTESGLSITEWKPISGVVPPLSDADWAKEFDAYKKIPQYAAMNADMTLDGFKTIFWWEWAHRLLARFLARRSLSPACGFGSEEHSEGDFGKRIAVATSSRAPSRSSAGGWCRRGFPSARRSRKNGSRSTCSSPPRPSPP